MAKHPPYHALHRTVGTPRPRVVENIRGLAEGRRVRLKSFFACGGMVRVAKKSSG